MKNIGYWSAKLLYKLKRNDKEVISRYFRNAGMKIGGGCNICCNIMTSEPYLISIGDNVTIAGNVTFVTHDNSISKIDTRYANLFGYVEIGNNCFLGQNVTVMYGVTLANNIIVASGSVVCNSFSEENIIIGGNPAKKIGNWNSLEAKGKCYAMKKREAFEAAENKEYRKFVKRKKM